MKTPWGFLSGLVSRKPNPKKADEPKAYIHREPTEPQSPAEASAVGELDQGDQVHEVVEVVPDAEPTQASEPTAEAATVSDAGDEEAVKQTEQQGFSQSSNDFVSKATDELSEPNSGNEATAHSTALARATSGDPSAVVVSKAKRDTITRKRVSVKDAEEIQPGPEAPTFFEELLAADREIETLRNRLAEKLTAQNEQLRKMLARFDRS